jgi:hypothetical protein
MRKLIQTHQRPLLLVGLLFLASLVSTAQRTSGPLVSAVDAVNTNVYDMDRAVNFYSGVLSFQKVSDTEVAGENYEHLEGVFGVRMRVVRMRLGQEFIELTEYLAPKAHPRRRAQQRPFFPAHCDHRERHG